MFLLDGSAIKGVGDTWIGGWIEGQFDTYIKMMDRSRDCQIDRQKNG
jgi:hypothetical protein